MKVYRVKAKSIFTRSKLGIFVLNHYIGCLHGCFYCYAKFYCKFWKERLRIREKWGEWVIVKENAPELVRGKLISGDVWMSSISDPYQPIEKKIMLTRKILENLDKRTNLSILTKSKLVLRDIDIFKKFKNIEVGLTVSFLDKFEKRASKNEERIEALKILKENGIKTYCFISPVIPNLNDPEEIYREVKDFVDKVYIEVLNFKKCGREFLRILEERYPESFEIFEKKEKFELFLKKVKEFGKRTNAEIIVHH